MMSMIFYIIVGVVCYGTNIYVAVGVNVQFYCVNFAVLLLNQDNLVLLFCCNVLYYFSWVFVMVDLVDQVDLVDLLVLVGIISYVLDAFLVYVFWS